MNYYYQINFSEDVSHSTAYTREAIITKNTILYDLIDKIYYHYIHTLISLHKYIYTYTLTHTHTYMCTYTHKYIYIYIYIHHHHVAPPAQISLTLSCHPFLSSITLGRSSKATSCISTELLYIGSSWSSGLCLSMWKGPQEYEFVLTSPAVSHMSWIVFMIVGRWANSKYFVGCCLQACSILLTAFLCNSFFSIHLVSVHEVHPYSSIDTTAAWKKLCFIVSVRSDFHITNSLSIAVHAFASYVLMSWLMRYCFLSRWTCLLVSKNYRLVWRYCLFD